VTNPSNNRNLCAQRRWAEALFCGLVLAIATAFADGPAVVLRPPSADPVRVRVEVVNTPAARDRGLMHRKKLPADAGMLFVFPKQEVLEFWMKDTLIPLDMIFLDRDRKVVGVVENAKPLTEDARGVGKPSIYVLEVNAGFASKHGVGAGTTAEFVAVPPGAK